MSDNRHIPLNSAPSAARAFKIALALLVLLLIVSRLIALSNHAFHHDEAIHSYYSWKLANEGPQAYKYDPVYHGPFLFHLGALFQKIFPDTDFYARLPYTVVGILLVLLFLLWRNLLGWGGCLTLLALFVLSPLIDYYSRFARNDVYQIAWLAGMIVAGALYLHTARLRWLNAAAFFLILSYCTKENSYVNNFGVCLFLVAWGALRFLKNFREGMQLIFVRFYPLTRLLLLYACFSVFTFLFVAIDSRVGPDTNLLNGLQQIASASTALSDRAPAGMEATAGGYFTAPKREAAFYIYLGSAFFATLLLLIVTEFISLSLRLAQKKIGTQPPSIIPFFLWIVFFYLLFGALLISLLIWPDTDAPFIYELNRAVWGRAGVLALIVLLLPAIDATMRRAFRFGVSWRAWNDRVFDLWSFVFQVMLAVWIFVFLFSSMGTNLEGGIQAGLYDYLGYWFRQQTGEFRIWNVWWYYIPRLLLYEILPLALIYIFSTILLFRSNLTKLARKKDPADEGLQPVEPEPDTSGACCRKVPAPLLVFAAWLAIYFFMLYALLNEKVPWLMTYQSFAFNLLAGLLVVQFFAMRPAGAPKWRYALLAVIVAPILCFSLYQHVVAVYLRPTHPSELITYTCTTEEFHSHVDNIHNMIRAAKIAGEPLPQITVEGNAEWPCAWYFRNLPVKWKSFDLDRDIQIADDTPENRRRMHPARGPVWDVDPVPLRGWWLTPETRQALPEKLNLIGNIVALMQNRENDQREKFKIAGRPVPEHYSQKFAEQILDYVLWRRMWYPTGSQNVLVAYKTGRALPLRESRGYLDGSNAEPVPWSPQKIIVADAFTSPALSQPRGVDVDISGNIYLADSRNGRILQLAPDGALNESIGEGKLNPEWSGPCDVAIDAAGNVYVTDTWNHAVKKFAPDGELLAETQFGRQNEQRVRLFGPRGIAIGRRGLIYVTDAGNHFVRVFDAELKPLFSFGGQGAAPGQFNEPVGIALDAQNRIYVADPGNGRIQRFDALGGFEKELLTFMPEQHEVVGWEPHLAALADGRIALSVSIRQTFWLIDPEKMQTEIRQLPLLEIEHPLGIVERVPGELWITGRNNSTIGIYDLNLEAESSSGENDD